MFRELFGRLRTQLRSIEDKYTNLEINMQVGSLMLEQREGFKKTWNLIKDFWPTGIPPART
jgi:hypothetical protein